MAEDRRKAEKERRDKAFENYRKVSSWNPHGLAYFVNDDNGGRRKDHEERKNHDRLAGRYLAHPLSSFREGFRDGLRAAYRERKIREHDKQPG